MDDQVNRMLEKEKEFQRPKTEDDVLISKMQEEEMKKQKLADEEFKIVEAKFQKYEAAMKKRLAEMDIKLTNVDEDEVRAQVRKEYDDKVEKEKKKMEKQLKKYEHQKNKEEERRRRALRELEELRKQVERPLSEDIDDDDDSDSDQEYRLQEVEKNKKRTAELEVHLRKAKEQRHIEVLTELLKLKQDKLTQAELEANPQESWEEIEQNQLTWSKQKLKEEELSSFKQFELYMKRKHFEEQQKRKQDRTEKQKKVADSKWGAFKRRKSAKVFEIKEDEMVEEELPPFVDEGNSNEDNSSDDSLDELLESLDPDKKDDDTQIDFRDPGTWSKKDMKSLGKDKFSTWNAAHARGMSLSTAHQPLPEHQRNKTSGDIPSFSGEEMDNCRCVLKVHVKGATKLVKPGNIYVVVVPTDSNMDALRQQKTRTIKGSSDPEFDDNFLWTSTSKIKFIKFTVWVKVRRIGKPKCLGTGSIKIRKRGEGTHISRLYLKSRPRKRDDVGEGSLKVSYTYTES